MVAEYVIEDVAITYARWFAGTAEVLERPSSGTTESHLTFSLNDLTAARSRRRSSRASDILRNIFCTKRPRSESFKWKYAE